MKKLPRILFLSSGLCLLLGTSFFLGRSLEAKFHVSSFSKDDSKASSYALSRDVHWVMEYLDQVDGSRTSLQSPSLYEKMGKTLEKTVETLSRDDLMQLTVANVTKGQYQEVGEELTLSSIVVQDTWSRLFPASLYQDRYYEGDACLLRYDKETKTYFFKKDCPSQKGLGTIRQVVGSSLKSDALSVVVTLYDAIEKDDGYQIQSAGVLLQTVADVEQFSYLDYLDQLPLYRLHFAVEDGHYLFHKIERIQ